MISSKQESDWTSVFREVAETWSQSKRGSKLWRTLFALWSISMAAGVIILYVLLAKQRSEALERIRAQEAISKEAVAQLAEQQTLILELRTRFQADMRAMLAQKADTAVVAQRFQNVEGQIAGRATRNDVQEIRGRFTMYATKAELTQQVGTRVTLDQLNAQSSALRTHTDTLNRNLAGLVSAKADASTMDSRLDLKADKATEDQRNQTVNTEIGNIKEQLGNRITRDELNRQLQSRITRDELQNTLRQRDSSLQSKNDSTQ